MNHCIIDYNTIMTKEAFETKEEMDEWWFGHLEEEIESYNEWLERIDKEFPTVRRTRLDSRYIELVADRNACLKDLSKLEKQMEDAKQQRVEAQPIFK